MFPLFLLLALFSAVGGKKPAAPSSTGKGPTPVGIPKGAPLSTTAQEEDMAIEVEGSSVGPVGVEGAAFGVALTGNKAQAQDISRASVREDQEAAQALGPVVGAPLKALIAPLGSLQTEAVGATAMTAGSIEKALKGVL